MARVGLIFGSSTGTTATVAAQMAAQLSPLLGDPVNIRYGRVDAMLACDAMVLGVPTWGIGELQDDWERTRRRIRCEDFTGKLVAMFGLGDQISYPDHFLNAMGTLHELLASRGARFVGSWPTEGYDFETSSAVVDGRFVGLALDEDNQSDLTGARIEQWLQSIRPAFARRV